MIKSFGLTLLFWTLFVLFNTISDAILFYSVFPWYKNMDLWHTLKYFWIGFAVLTGVFALRLWMKLKYLIYYAEYRNDPGREMRLQGKKKYRLKATLIYGFFLLWFCLLRWITHETLMEIWRQK